MFSIVTMKSNLYRFKKSVDVKKAVEFYISSPKKFYFAGFAKRAKGLDAYNIQTRRGVPRKSKEQTQQLRSSFLTR